MAIIFNGRKFAKEKEDELRVKTQELKEKRVTPKLASILVGDNTASLLYLKLKKKAADRVGCILEVKKFGSTPRIEDSIHRIKTLIKSLNRDRTVHGIMIQLPLPKDFSWDDRNEIINAISGDKDVDGMRDDSPFPAPVVKAVLDILVEARVGPCTGSDPERRQIAVVGAGGFVGKKIMKELQTMNYREAASSAYELRGYDIDTKNLDGELQKADIIISATGVPDLITTDMVKAGAVLIDVGAPKGDISYEAYKKASFVSPVPGGVGPVTIACLLENLIESASKE